MRFKTISSRVVYKNSIITVSEDKVKYPDGTTGIYAFTSVPRTVGIVPIDKGLYIYLCRQYRYIFKDESWEIPRGLVDKNETITQAAKRELLEEAKLTSKNIKNIASLRLSTGFLDEECEIFLAQNVTKALYYADKEYEIDKVKRFPLKKVLSMIDKNEIVDGLTVGGILKVKQILGI